MNYTILTGASRGIGLATAKELIKNGSHVMAVSRHENKALIEYAKNKPGYIDYFEFDLSGIDQINELVDKIFENINTDEAESIHLVNNAGVLEPVKLMLEISPSEYKKNLDVNLISPMALISEFLKHTDDLQIDKRIINISSGAGDHPYEGWAAYCTSKAGIDMLTRVVKTEQEKAQYPAKVISFAPGVVATNMQKHIRSKNKDQFPRVENFKQLKENNHLLEPQIVGQRIVELLYGNYFPDGDKIDIRD